MHRKRPSSTQARGLAQVPANPSFDHLRLLPSGLDWRHPRNPPRSGVGCHRMKSRAIKKWQRELAKRTPQYNRDRSRFLAVSHDIRQPLHALGLFVAQLRSLAHEVELNRIVEQIDTAVSTLNERFGELFDPSEVGDAAATLNGGNGIDANSSTPACVLPDRTNGKLIVVIDDDPLVLDSTCGLLRSWGCSVVAASGSGALASLLDKQ